MKEMQVAFVEEKMKEAYDGLGSGKSEDKKLHAFIGRAIGDLKRDPECGIKVPKELIPREYVRKYGVTNLWKYNLPGAWRLLYTIKADEVAVVSVIIEWMSHKDYEKRFKYHKN